MKRYIKIICCIVIVAALAILVKSRWNAWFKNVPEEPYAAATVPDRITLTPGEDFMSERTVSWRCGDTLAQSFLTLTAGGDTATFKATGSVIESRGGRDAFYYVTIDSLQPGSKYSYRVTTAGKQSREYRFAMPDVDEPARRFLFFGDVQDNIGGQSGEWFAKLYRQYPDVDFWACAGDLIERPIETYWNYLYQSADTILATMPLLNSTGNHDYLKGLYLTIDPRWRHTFVYPCNGAKTAIGISYYIDMPGMRFIVLDTNGIQDCVTITTRYQWLKRVLASAGDKWKVVMWHHPAYSVRSSRINLPVRNTFVPLLERYGVHLVLQGHEHGFMRHIGTCGDHPVYLISYMSPKSYKLRKSSPGFKVIADTPMYHIVDYNNSTMEVRSYALANDSIMDFVKISR